jgi:formamidopyrimidine-DNA glycosylase
MPELPDVEKVRRDLDAWTRGAKIVAAHSADRRILRPRAPSAFGRALVGKTVRDVARRGKWLRIELDDGTRLFSHLGMTGWWVASDDAIAEAPRFERARIDLSRRAERSSIRYVDSRRFGRLIVSKEDIPEWRELGPDPLANGIDLRAFGATLAKRRRSIKDVLMDQTVLAGIGNILATEALWHARIDPRSRASALSASDAKAIVRGLRTAIDRELAARDVPTGADWRDVFFAYGHTGDPCPRDRTPFVRVVQAGRTTTFCKRCQIRRR